jgi:hypothetical protein
MEIRRLGAGQRLAQRRLDRRPAMVWMFQVKASTSRQSPSARNNPAAAAASCDCKAASNDVSQPSASACGV